jgi:hypothetical protein
MDRILVYLRQILQMTNKIIESDTVQISTWKDMI